MVNTYSKQSLLDNFWQLKDCDERNAIMLSQRYNISLNLSKLLSLRKINDDKINLFFNPNINDNLPNPFILKDMTKSINRSIEAISKNQKIAIIADYDVDGSTSLALLYKFFLSLNLKIICKIPDRLIEGYGPNQRIMNELKNEDVGLIFALDCGTTSFNVFNEHNDKKIDIIVIDHHISEKRFPNIYSIINPNRFDENNNFKDLASVGLTFLFIMGLRKKLRDLNYFSKNKKEPNLLINLDLVALGTICDSVHLSEYNRLFVYEGLEILKKRKNLGISKIIDNSKISHTPTSTDLGYIIGPQLNAASRIDDSTLPSKILISNDSVEVEKIAKKLFLLNEKRKIIEKNIYDEAFKQALEQINSKFLIVYGTNWHKGTLGIIASRLVEKFHKPSFVISINNNVGTGSVRSIDHIDIGNMILNAKKIGLLLSGGGHKKAAGLQINYKKIDDFKLFLNNFFDKINNIYFRKVVLYDLKLSLNEINIDLLESIERLEPYGNGNEEPKFIISDLSIDRYKILKEKHLLIFFKNDLGKNIKGICFNCIGTKLGENLIYNKNNKYEFGCVVKRDKFGNNLNPQLIIQDALIK